ncbi:MAG: hypothetical protein EXQ50_00210 [Acidobacteria bacterium]|nr:hypothetical protein [Acidobacteriota bacterium]MSO60509.1 hypothetical protein [Acidobacteriota bacterium]
MAARKTHPLIKIAIALLVLAGGGWLFVRSAQDSRAEPYQMSSRHLQGWTLGIDTAADSQGSVVSLRPPAELPMNLFRQLFSRQMESMGTPSMPGIPLVLRHELPSALTAEQVLGLAQSAGLDRSVITPTCVGYRRVSAMGATRQLYYVLFAVSGFEGFRAALAGPAGPGFKADTLSPVLMMAAQPDFTGWMPIGADAQRDCVAPVTVE